MGSYVVGSDGVLVRHPMSYLEELRVLEETPEPA
jgi:hypothetical protein